MIGGKIQLRDDLELRRMIENELINIHDEERLATREEAKENLLKIQEENKRTFNKRRKVAKGYLVGDLVAIQQTQFGSGLKLYPKFLGLYEVTAVKRNDRYGVEKVGDHEGPRITTTSADHMKPWSKETDYFSDVEE